jgi:hypothetical protein
MIPPFGKIRPVFSDFLKIVTVPPGARVLLQRIDRPDSTWRFVGETPIESLAVARAGNGSNYKVRIERAGFEPRGGTRKLFFDLLQVVRPHAPDRHPAGSTASGRTPAWCESMARLAVTHRSPITMSQKTEVTNREYARFVAAGGYTKRDYWAEPVQKDGHPVVWEQANRGV